MPPTTQTARGEQVAAWLETLTAIERPATSAGERQAAEWIAIELEEMGVAARVEPEPVRPGLLPLWGPNLLSAVSALLPRRLGLGLSALAMAAIVDELEGLGQRLRRVLPMRTAFNVVAELGEANAPRSIVVCSHHDVAHAFHPLFARIASAPPPGGRGGRALPVTGSLAWGPALVTLGRALRRSRLTLAGAASSLGAAAIMLDVNRRDPVPGANDNASAVAALLGVASTLKNEALPGVRVILLSTGAEETMMLGMQAFLARHGDELAPERTLVVCLDAVGWETLVLRRGEGPLRTRTSPRQLLDETLDAARAARVDLEEAPPFPVPTDGLVARRAGYPTIFLSSYAADGGSPHYHQPTDVPENVDLSTVEAATAVCAQLIRSAVAPS